MTAIFSCQTRISRYRNEQAWRFEIAPIGRKPGLGSGTSKRTLFKATRTEAWSSKFHETLPWPGSERQRSPGAGHRAHGAGRRAEPHHPHLHPGCWATLPQLSTPSRSGGSEASSKFGGRGREPSEAAAPRTAGGEYPEAARPRGRPGPRAAAAPRGHRRGAAQARGRAGKAAGRWRAGLRRGAGVASAGEATRGGRGTSGQGGAWGRAPRFPGGRGPACVR